VAHQFSLRGAKIALSEERGDESKGILYYLCNLHKAAITGGFYNFKMTACEAVIL